MDLKFCDLEGVNPDNGSVLDTVQEKVIIPKLRSDEEAANKSDVNRIYPIDSDMSYDTWPSAITVES